MNEWQQQVGRSLRGGIKKGEVVFTVLKSRGGGKSTYAEMQMKFTSAWTKWENTWLWKPKKSSRSNKLIVGNVMVRKNKFMINNGGQVIEYASLKEALTQQREEFKEILSRG